MLYVFDSNSLRVLGNYYPGRFPTFWTRFEKEVASGMVVSVREVYKELERQMADTWLWDWLQDHRRMFLTPDPQETGFLGEIFKVPHFRTLVGEAQRLRGYPVADPFVVACAKIREGCVVTEEAKKPNAAKIPNVCEHFGVDCTNVEGFLARNDWQF
jgi:hypothetical protein